MTGGWRMTGDGEAGALRGASLGLVNPRVDAWLTTWAWLVPFALYAILRWLPGGIYLTGALFLLLDTSHQIATLPLTVLDPGTPRPLLRIYGLGAASLGALALGVWWVLPGDLGIRAWMSVYLYWGSFHIARQHYGLLRWFQARDGTLSTTAGRRRARVEVWALYAGLAAPVLLYLQDDLAFRSGRGAALLRLPVPGFIAWAVAALAAGTFGVLLAMQLRAATQGEALVSPRLKHLLLAVSNYWLGILVVGAHDVMLATIFITSYHNVQYNALTYHIGRERFIRRGQAAPRWVRHLYRSLPRFLVAICLGGLLLDALRGGTLPTAGALASLPYGRAFMLLCTSYTYLHYFIDGWMWKFRRDPRLSSELGLSAAVPRSTGASAALG